MGAIGAVLGHRTALRIRASEEPAGGSAIRAVLGVLIGGLVAIIGLLYTLFLLVALVLLALGFKFNIDVTLPFGVRVGGP